jgi:hypothetical protein
MTSIRYPQRSDSMVRSTRNTLAVRIAQAERASDSTGSSRVVSPDDYSLDFSTMTTFPPLSRGKSQSIPITKGIHRTPSEIQLCEDEAIADYRDYCMFARIVDGIQRRQSSNQDLDLIYENDACLANIRRTRCVPPEESQSLESRHQSLLQRLGGNMISQPQAVYPDNMVLDEDEIFVIDL